MKKIVVYTTSHCPYCVRAKQLLSGKNLPFEEINLTDKPQQLAELKQRTGWRTVPQIFIDEVLVGGYTELAALDKEGKL